jgi:hypothetical protein
MSMPRVTCSLLVPAGPPSSRRSDEASTEQEKRRRFGHSGGSGRKVRNEAVLETPAEI